MKKLLNGIRLFVLFLFLSVSCYGKAGLSFVSDTDTTTDLKTTAIAPIKMIQSDLDRVAGLNKSALANYQAAVDSAEAASSSSTTTTSLLSTMSLSSVSSSTLGNLPIQSTVDGAGGLNVSVPIKSFPGIGGANPQIALSYNSQQGYGILGYGWSVSGTSKITAENKSIYYDDETAAPVSSAYFSITDALYLDGQRLIETSVGKYKTVTGNIKVVATALIQNRYLSGLKVYYPNGAIATFAKESYSYKDYPITKLVDKNGNSMSFSYTTGSSTDYHYYLKKITYCNSGASINFGYTSFRSAVQHVPVYQSGYAYSFPKYLSSIKCVLNGNTLRDYSMNLKNWNGTYYCLLSKVNCTTYDSDGNSASSSVSFSYGDGATSSLYYSVASQCSSYFDFDDPDDIHVLTGKMGWSTSTDDAALVTYPVSDYSGFYAENKAHYFDCAYDSDQKIVVCDRIKTTSSSTINLASTITAGEGFVGLLFADVDPYPGEELLKINDYYDDGEEIMKVTVYISSSSSGLVVRRTCTFDLGSQGAYTYKGHEFVLPKQFYACDYDGDGLQELLYVTATTTLTGTYTHYYGLLDLSSGTGSILANKTNSAFTYNEYFNHESGSNTKSPSESDQMTVFDYNGDGKDDICLVNSTGIHFYTFSGTTLSSSASTTSTFKLAAVEDSQFRVGDFNADGLPDLYVPYGDAAGIYLNKGNGSFATGWSESELPTTSTTRDYIVQDINGDGYSDIITYYVSGSKTYIYPYLNRQRAGGSFVLSGYKTLSSAGAIATMNTNSLYNTGKIACMEDDGTLTTYTRKNNEGYDQLLTSYTDILGTEHDFDYGMMVSSSYTDIEDDGSTYTPKYIGTSYFPYTPFSSGNVWLVKSKQSSWEDTDLENWTYTYTGAVVHRQGLGFCGFSSVSFTDSVSGNYINSTFNPLNFGIPKTIANKKRTNTYTYTVTVDSNKRRHLLLTKLVSANKATSASTTTTSSYDSYDSPTSQTVSYSGGLTNTTTTSYENDTTTSAYFIGLPVKIKAVKTLNSNTFTTLDSVYYDDDDNVSETASYINSNLKGRAYNTYNSYGLVSKKEIQQYTSSNKLSENCTYDTYGRPLTKTDSLGLETSYSYDSFYGLLAKISSPSDTISYSYDVWGRKTEEAHSSGENNLMDYSYTKASSSTVYSYYVTKSNDESRFYEVEYYDGFGRKVLSAHHDVEGNLVYTKRVYDDNGLIKKVSLPYFSDNSTSGWTKYSYDSYDRPTTISLAAGGKEIFGYDGLEVTHTKDGVAVTQTYDGAGNLLSSEDDGGTTTYTLRADGQPSAITAPGSISTTFTYDGYGRRTKIVDPSSGTKSFAYDAAGNQSKVTDANGKIISMTYDKYHRLTNKINAENISTDYSYDSHGNVTSEVSTNGTYTYLTYDDYDRLAKITKSIVDGQLLSKTYSYNNIGQLASTTYVDADGTIGTVKNSYTYGYLKTKKWKDTGDVIYKISSENALGLPTEVTTGEITRAYTYTGSNGYRLSKIVDTPESGTSGKLNYSYSFNTSTGNLSSWSDNTNSLSESYGYDGLNRLTSYGDNTVTYDSNGNILTKTDAGTFSYDSSSKPYAVTGLLPGSNTVPLNTQKITYTSFMRPSTITENNYVAAFTYDVSGDRVKTHITHNGSLYLDRYYIGGVYEKDSTSTTIKKKLYLGGDYYSASVVMVQEDGGEWTFYNILRDRQGSIMKVVSEDGSSVEGSYSYDAWGRMRNPSSLDVYDIGSEPDLFLGRGYTGHEYLPMFGLINMNARLYDPLLGRFLSPDPYVQNPLSSQNFNRYAYCLNNPLVYVDKDGQAFIIDDVIAGILGAVTNLATNAIQGHINGNILQIIGKSLAAAGSGFVSGVGAVEPELGGWLWGGAILGATNTWLRGGNTIEDYVRGTISGIASDYLGGKVGDVVSGVVRTSLPETTKPIVSKIITNVTGQVSETYSSSVTENVIVYKEGWEAFKDAADWKSLGIAAVKGTAKGILEYRSDVKNTRENDNNSNSNSGMSKLDINASTQQVKILTQRTQLLALPAAKTLLALPASTNITLNSSFNDITGVSYTVSHIK